MQKYAVVSAVLLGTQPMLLKLAKRFVRGLGLPMSAAIERIASWRVVAGEAQLRTAGVACQIIRHRAAAFHVRDAKPLWTRW
jgi:hypothetical protein